MQWPSLQPAKSPQADDCLAALGDINVAGAIESNGNMSITSQFGSLNATGGINSGGTLGIATGLDLALGTSTSAIGDATLNAGRDAVLNGTFVGQGNGVITAGRDITGGGSQAFTDAAVLAAQREISLSGSLQGNSIQATGGGNVALNNATSSTTLTVTANGSGAMVMPRLPGRQALLAPFRSTQRETSS